MDNVIPFRKQSPVFTKELRSSIRDSLAKHTEKPEEAVDAVESAICNFLVSVVRKVATNLGTKAGNALVKKLS